MKSENSLADGTANLQNKTLPQTRERNEENCEGKGEAIVAIPPVVRVVPVRVQPAVIVVAVGIEQVRVAVRITQNIIRATAP